MNLPGGASWTVGAASTADVGDDGDVAVADVAGVFTEGPRRS
jgi:hypothetical protein